MNRFQPPITSILLAAWLLPAAVCCHALGQEDSAKLVAVLQSNADTYEKAQACQQLAVVGDAQAVPTLAGLLDHEQLANYARYALEAIPGPDAAAALRDAAGRLQGQRLVGVINSIGRGRDAAAVDQLKPLLINPDTAIAAAAATALGRIGDAKAADALTEALATAQADRIAALADGCLICASVLSKHDQPERAMALYDAIAGIDIPQHLVLAATLHKILAQGQAGLPLLAEQLESDDEARFRVALQAIRGLGGEAVGWLAEKFDDLPPARQSLAVLILGDLGDPSVLPTVLKAAQSDNRELRIQSFRVLGKRGDASALPVLLDAAVATDQGTSAAARSALADLRSDAVDAAIVNLLDSSDGAKLLLAIELAGERRIAAAAPRLLTLADSPDAALRLAAVRSLGSTIPLDDLPKLIAKLAAAKSEDEQQAAREAVRVAVAGVPDRDACAQCLAKALAKALAGKTPDVRDYLLEQLAAVGGSTALDAVVAAARSNDESLQDAATRVLGTWMTADVAAPLLELCKSQTTSKYRIRLLRGYIRVARQLSVAHDETLEICRHALQLADRDEERQLVLDVLARLATPEAQVLIYKVSEPDEETGFVPLFDGQTLKGWEGNLDMSRSRTEPSWAAV